MVSYYSQYKAGVSWLHRDHRDELICQHQEYVEKDVGAAARGQTVSSVTVTICCCVTVAAALVDVNTTRARGSAQMSQ